MLWKIADLQKVKLGGQIMAKHRKTSTKFLSLVLATAVVFVIFSVNVFSSAEVNVQGSNSVVQGNAGVQVPGSSRQSSDTMRFHIWVLDENGNSLTAVNEYQPGLQISDPDGMPIFPHRTLNKFGVATIPIQKSSNNWYTYFVYGTNDNYKDYHGGALVMTADETFIKVELALKSSLDETKITLTKPGEAGYPKDPRNPNNDPSDKAKSIKGTVTDGGGSPVEGVSITIADAKKNNVRNALTDSFGNYRLENLTDGLFGGETVDITATKEEDKYAPYENVRFLGIEDEAIYNFVGKNVSTKPALPAPTGINWSITQEPFNVTATWDAVTNAGAYNLNLYKSGSNTPVNILGIQATSHDLTQMIIDGGYGDYYFQVQAIPQDPVNYNTSVLSVKSSIHSYLDPNPDPGPGPGPGPDPDPDPGPDPGPSPKPDPAPTPPSIPAPNPGSEIVGSGTNTNQNTTRNPREERNNSSSDNTSSTKNVSSAKSANGLIGTTNKTATVDAKQASKAVASAIDIAIKTGSDVSVTFKNVSSVAPNSAKIIAEAAKKANKQSTIIIEHIQGNSVLSKITVDAAKLAAIPTLVDLRVDPTPAATKSVSNKFERYFGNNTNLRFIALGQQGTYGMPVSIAAKVDLTNINTKTLHFYSYNKSTNTYKQITKPEYFIDKNNYLHFSTTNAGTIIISDAQLKSK